MCWLCWDLRWLHWPFMTFQILLNIFLICGIFLCSSLVLYLWSLTPQFCHLYLLHIWYQDYWASVLITGMWELFHGGGPRNWFLNMQRSGFDACCVFSSIYSSESFSFLLLPVVELTNWVHWLRFSCCGRRQSSVREVGFKMWGWCNSSFWVLEDCKVYAWL